MELQELDFLRVGEGVESPCFELREGGVCWSKNGQSAVGVVELAVELRVDLGGLQQADEKVEVAGFFKDFGDIGWSWRCWSVGGWDCVWACSWALG